MAAPPFQESTHQRFFGGAASIAHFADLLGLVAGSGLSCVLQQVAWERDHVELILAAPESGDVRVQIRTAVAGTPALLVAGRLAVSYSGKSLPPGVADRLHQVAVPRLAELAMDDLAAVLGADPDRVVPEPPPVVTAPGQGQPTGQLDTWGVGDSWADFVAAGEVSRARLDSVEPTRLFRFIQHGESECSQVLPRGPGPTVSMVDYPWEDRFRDRDEAPWTHVRSGLPEDDEPLITTDLTEADVVCGNPKKLQDILEHAIHRPDPEGRTILFSNTCVPVVTGEDVESVVRRYADKSPVPLLFLTVTPRSMLNVFQQLLVTHRLEAEATAGPPAPDAINLIGYPDSRTTQELVSMLATFGVRVNVQLIPDISTQRVAQLPGAALNVVLPNRLWDNLYVQVFQDSRIPHIAPTAPWGLAGTRAWLRQILDALQRDAADFDAGWAEYLRAFQPAWDQASVRCRGHRLGFALRGRDVHVLADPSYTWGYSMVAQIEEAGFGLDVLLLLRDAQDARTRAGQVHALFADPSRHSLKGFQTLSMLRERLANAPAQAFFSTHVFDWRLTEAGKNRFSIQHFELGVPGAIRTMHRLCDLCDTPLVREYRRFFARTEGGTPVDQEGHR